MPGHAVVRRRSELLRAAVMATASWCLVRSSCGFVAVPALSLGSTPAAGQRDALAGWRGNSKASGNSPAHLRRTFSGGGPGLSGGFGGSGPGLGGGGKPEPPWISIAFFGAVILNFIPGPWHIILDPIFSLLSFFYSLLFTSILLIPILLFAAVFAFQWYLESQLDTICEGKCPECGTQQVGTKNGTFPCAACGLDLEVEDGEFIKYVKSGKAPPSTPFEQMEDFAKQAAEKGENLSSKEASSKVSSDVEVIDVEPTKKKTKSDVIDVDVL